MGKKVKLLALHFIHGNYLRINVKNFTGVRKKSTTEKFRNERKFRIFSIL